MAINVRDNQVRVNLGTNENQFAYFGARAYVTKEGEQAIITCVDKDGKTVAYVNDGVQGEQGEAGIGINAISINDDARLVIELTDGTEWISEMPVIGERGQDGDTPAFTNATATIVTDGGDPEVSVAVAPVEEESLNYGLDFTFKNIEGKNGADGKTPVKGVDYFDGEDNVYIGDTPPLDAKVWIAPDEQGNAILRIKNASGQWVGIPSIKGENGNDGDAGNVDDALSPISTLPVQNRAIYYAMQGIQSQLSAYDNEISRVDGRIDATNADVAAEGVRISAITQNIRNIGNTLDYHWQTIVAQEQAVEDLGNDVRTKADASVVETIQSDIEGVEQTVESHTTQIGENASSIEALGTEIESKADEAAVSNLQAIVDGKADKPTVYTNKVSVGELLIQWGSVDIKPNTGSSPNYYGTATVTFPEEFASTPHVTISSASGYTEIKNWNAYSPSATSFSAMITSSAQTSRTGRWFAIGKKKGV